MKRIISKLDWERLNDLTVNELKLRFYSDGELYHIFGDRPDDHIVEITFEKSAEMSEVESGREFQEELKKEFGEFGEAINVRSRRLLGQPGKVLSAKFVLTTEVFISDKELQDSIFDVKKFSYMDLVHDIERAIVQILPAFNVNAETVAGNKIRLNSHLPQDAIFMHPKTYYNMMSNHLFYGLEKLRYSGRKD